MPHPQTAGVHLSPSEHTTELVLSGVVDLFVAGSLRDAGLQCAALGRATQVRCEGLERIDASALQVLLALERELRTRELGLELVGVPERVRAYLATAAAQPLLARLVPEAAGSTEPCAAAEPARVEAAADPGAPVPGQSAPAASPARSAPPADFWDSPEAQRESQ